MESVVFRRRVVLISVSGAAHPYYKARAPPGGGLAGTFGSITSDEVICETNGDEKEIDLQCGVIIITASADPGRPWTPGRGVAIHGNSSDNDP
ncbi:hypothetical protein KGM_201866 [Danaus plexippus plexippus]|uniref:Uncharacterized protein n=1 Tax=Danaus plexippus plexippus TaxID=278856 RepID=A0A212FBR7_DANPL|nr:hypothetical protein KGM_201866 [Danaus plexippus plexippus]